MGEEKLSIKAREALLHIRNAIMHTGKVPSTRFLMDVMNYKSPRSAVLLMEELENNGFLQRKKDGGYQLIKDLEVGNRTVSIPLVGSAPCGAPMLAQENIEAMISVSTSLARPGSKYFLLRAIGNSMDKAGIEDGDLVLVKQQPAPDHNGQAIVALIDDEATIKEYYSKGSIIILQPKSTNPKHQPIVLTNDFKVQGVVIARIPKN